MSTATGIRAHRWVGPPTGLMDAECERCGVFYDSDGYDKPCKGPIFYRQDRYEVIKYADIAKLPQAQQNIVWNLLGSVATLLQEAGMKHRECVVVESDWPIYERTWRGIESQFYKEQRAKKNE